MHTEYSTVVVNERTTTTTTTTTGKDGWTYWTSSLHFTSVHFTLITRKVKLFVSVLRCVIYYSCLLLLPQQQLKTKKPTTTNTTNHISSTTNIHYFTTTWSSVLLCGVCSALVGFVVGVIETWDIYCTIQYHTCLQIHDNKSTMGRPDDVGHKQRPVRTSTSFRADMFVSSKILRTYKNLASLTCESVTMRSRPGTRSKGLSSETIVPFVILCPKHDSDVPPT